MDTTAITPDQTILRLEEAIAAIRDGKDCGIVLLLIDINDPAKKPTVFSSSGPPKAGYVLAALGAACKAISKTLERAAKAHGFNEMEFRRMTRGLRK